MQLMLGSEAVVLRDLAGRFRRTSLYGHMAKNRFMSMLRRKHNPLSFLTAAITKFLRSHASTRSKLTVSSGWLKSLASINTPGVDAHLDRLSDTELLVGLEALQDLNNQVTKQLFSRAATA